MMRVYCALLLVLMTKCGMHDIFTAYSLASGFAHISKTGIFAMSY